MNSGLWPVLVVVAIAVFAILISLDGGEDGKQNASRRREGRRARKAGARSADAAATTGSKGLDAEMASNLPPPRQSTLIIPPPDVQKIEAVPPVNR